MTTHSSLTPLDIKEHAVIERWRYIEKNRPPSNHRTTLAQQIQDKILYNDNQEKLSQAYARDSAKHKDILHLLEIRQEIDRRNLARDINEFRTTYQQANDAREYDLNDTSISTTCNSGPGSCLFFLGEDRNKQNRERKQKEQMNQWITEQCRQKYETTKEQQIFDQAYDCNQLMIAKRIEDLEATQLLFRHQLANDIRAFNRDLANQKQCQRDVKEAFELEDKKQEIQNMLTENPNLTISQFGPGRPLLTHIKF